MQSRKMSNSSLPADIGVWGCFFEHQIIPNQTFRRIRMNSAVENHPCKTFSSNQDQFPHWKSSLQNIFSKSGSISPPEVIPARHFHQIRMNPIAGNHLCKTFLANQDEFRHQKAFRQSCPPKAPVSASANKPQPQLLPASSASISALTASTIPESSRMRSLSMRLMGTEMENAYRDPPSSESAAAMQPTPASFSSLSSA